MSATLLFSWATSSPDTKTVSRIPKWVTETAAWLVFTSWFFRPALPDRAFPASGSDSIPSFLFGEIVTHGFSFTRSGFWGSNIDRLQTTFWFHRNLMPRSTVFTINVHNFLLSSTLRPSFLIKPTRNNIIETIIASEGCIEGCRSAAAIETRLQCGTLDYS
ncbi:hypothetical protein F5146DRAFT_288302 [Armillaria mellea]|nr:hypothetical protein F5146DRAFT_288302 [Armillaria mellea]